MSNEALVRHKAGELMIHIISLGKQYDPDTVALDRINITIRDGELVGIVGPAESGKTTLLQCINRVLEPGTGQVLIDGSDITGTEGTMLREMRRKIATIGQNADLVESIPVLNNVLMGRLGQLSLLQGMFGVYPSQDIRIAVDCLDKVKLRHRAGMLTGKLSRLQKQQVRVARALAQQPEIILVDEPLTGLNAYDSETLMRDITKLNKLDGITMIVAMRRPHPVLRHCNRIVGLLGGRVVYNGPPVEDEEENLLRIYAGNREIMPLEGAMSRVPPGSGDHHG